MPATTAPDSSTAATPLAGDPANERSVGPARGPKPAMAGAAREPAPVERQGWPAGLLDSLPVGLLTVDRRLMVRSANALGRRLLGVRRKGASIGRRLLDGLPEEDRRRLRLALANGHDGTGGDGDAFGLSCGEVRFEAADGVPRVLRVEARPRDARGVAVLACIDVTAARAETDQALHQANHDALTGLPNRAAIMARLDAALQRAREAQHRLAVMFIDLDRFKTLNDTHGHEAGDRLLREVAQRLRGALGEIGIPSRLGGDEFLVLLPALHDGDDVKALARQAAQALAEPIDLAGGRWRASASIGVSLFPEHGLEASVLLRRADLALYRVKRAGRNGIHLYDALLDGGEGRGDGDGTGDGTGSGDSGAAKRRSASTTPATSSAAPMSVKPSGQRPRKAQA